MIACVPHPQTVAISLTLAAFALAGIAKLAFDPIVTWPDFWYFVERAELQSLRGEQFQAAWAAIPAARREWVEPWANGFWPLGYPLLLAFFRRIIGDWAGAARAISWLSALSYAALTGTLAARLRGRSLGALAFCLTLSHPSLLWWSQAESTDLLAAALQMGALTLLVTHPLSRRATLVLAGLTLGVAYLVRYQALLVFLALLVWLLMQPAPAVLGRLRAGGLMLVGFILAALPQLLASQIAVGLPFYDLQWKNVWFFSFSTRGWWSWHSMPEAGSILSVVLSNPRHLAQHYVTEVVLAPLTSIPPLWRPMILGLGMLSLPRLLRFWRCRRGLRKTGNEIEAYRRSILPLGLLVAAALILSSALMRVTDRGLLPALWAQTGAVAWAFQSIEDRASARKGWQQTLRTLAARALPALVVVAGFAGHISLLQQSAQAHNATRAVSATLRQAGLTDARQALSSGFTLYDLPSERRYSTFMWDLAREPVDAADLVSLASQAGYRWLVLESLYSPSMFPLVRQMIDDPPGDTRVLLRIDRPHKVVVLSLPAPGVPR